MLAIVWITYRIGFGKRKQYTLLVVVWISIHRAIYRSIDKTYLNIFPDSCASEICDSTNLHVSSLCIRGLDRDVFAAHLPLRLALP